MAMLDMMLLLPHSTERVLLSLSLLTRGLQGLAHRDEEERVREGQRVDEAGRRPPQVPRGSITRNTDTKVELRRDLWFSKNAFF